MPYGNMSNIGISFQNSGYASLTNSVYWAEILDEDISVDKPPLVSQGMRGIYDEGAHYEGANTIGGTINMEAHPITLGAFLKAAMGAPTTVTSAAVYTHAFKPRTSEFDGRFAGHPMTIHKHLDDSGSATLFYDMVCNNIEIGVNNGELVMSKFGFVGGRYTQVAALTASYPTGKQWTWDQSSVQLGGAAISEIKQLTVVVDEAMEASGTLAGTKFPTRVKRTGFRTVTINGTMTFDDQTEYQQFLSQSERNLTAMFVGNTEIQSGYYNQLEIIVPLNRHTEYKPTVGGPGEIEVSFTSKGVYSTTSGTALQLNLRNTQAAY